MPAYFSMVMEFSRHELDYDNMKELLAYIKHAGLEFKGGVNGAENESIEDIMEYNQKKLEANFVLGNNEDKKNDYKQMLFSYGDFSEVRGYISNNYPADKEYSFTLLIPEEEVRIEGDTYKKDAVEKLKALAGSLWVLPKTRTFQTALELDDEIIPEEDVKAGKAPKACPFAIISEKQFGHMELKGYTDEHIYAGGVLIMPENIKLV